jgi:hypothetical protein
MLLVATVSRVPTLRARQLLFRGRGSMPHITPVAVRLKGYECLELTRDWFTGPQAGKNPITVPVQRGKTLKEGTARAILKSAGVTEQELFDVY